MPSAPNSRATFASCGVSALVRTPSLRNLSAQLMKVAKSPVSAGCEVGSVPANTSPVLPSSEIDAPCLIVLPLAVNSPAL